MTTPAPKRNWFMIVGLTVFGGGVLLCGFVFVLSILGGASSRRVATTYTVTYRVTTNFNGADLTYRNATGDTEQIQDAVTNPVWEKTFTGTPGQFVYISGQRTSRLVGTIRCEILVDGVVVKEAESRGEYVIATCSGQI